MTIGYIAGSNRAKPIACCAWIIILWATTVAQAVIIRRGDGSGNTSAPPDDPGWANVGQLGNDTAVYIANGWVLTAGHVGPGPVMLGDVQYEAVPDSWRRVRDPLRPGQLADLGLFQIQGKPATVRNLPIGREPPQVGTAVLAIGNGRNRNKDLTTWYVDPYSHPNVWRESPFPQGKVVRTGFKYADGQSKRWGISRINSLRSDVDYGQGPTCVIEMAFYDKGNGNDSETQLANHDSGGALFRKSDGTWKLIGILATKAGMEGQPDNTAVFGDLSYAIDLSAYASEIQTTIYGPDPPTWSEALLAKLKLQAIPLGSACGSVIVLIALLWWYYRRKKRNQDWVDFGN